MEVKVYEEGADYLIRTEITVPQKPVAELPDDALLSSLHPAPICFVSCLGSNGYFFGQYQSLCRNFDCATNTAEQPFEHCEFCIGWNGKEF